MLLKNIFKRCKLSAKTSALSSLICLSLLVQGYEIQGIRFRHIGKNQGLSTGSVYSIFQDKPGFIWFGSSDGLNRYDGNKIKIYRLGNEYTGGSSNFFEDGYAEDHKGNLYLNTRNGIVIYDRAGDCLKKFFPIKDSARLARLAKVVGIDANGMLWFTDGINHLYRYHPGNKKYTCINMGGYFGYRRKVIMSGDDFWFTTKEGLLRLNRKTGKTTVYLKELYTAGPCLFTFLQKVNENDLLITLKNDVLLLHCSDGTYRKLYSGNESTSSYVSLMDSSGRLLLGTYKSGLSILEKTGKIKHFTGDVYTGMGPCSNIISAMYQDKQGNTWLGCDGYGVSKFNLQEQKFGLFRNSSEQPQSLNQLFIKCILKTNDSLVWYGTHENGILEHNRNSNKIISFSAFGLSSSSVSDMILYDASHILVCGIGGVALVDIQTKKSRTLAFAKTRLAQEIPISGVYKTIKTKAGTRYFSTSDGLYYLNKNMNLEKVLLPWGMPHQMALYQTADSDLWVGSMEYGFTYRLKEKSPGTLSIVQHLFPRNNIRCFYQNASDSILWMASEKGLMAYNLSNEKLITYGCKQGFSNEYIYAILPGKEKELWLSTNNGLVCFDPSTGSVRNFYESDGLQSNEFNTGSYHRSADGELFFGGINGCSYFHPDRIKTSNRKSAPVLTSLEIVDKPFFLPGNSSLPSAIELPYTDNSFSLEFAALNFVNEDNITYRYKLAGLDKEWVNSGKKNYARYSGLKPGTYQFLCMAANSDGVWSRPVTLLSLDIRPPWWRKNWFLFILICSGLFLMYKIIRETSTRKLKQRLRELEKREAVNKERNRIAGDMHDDLGSGLTKISIMAQLMKSKSKSPEEINNYLEKISATSSELVDNMGHIIWAMNADNDTLENFLSYVRQYANQFFEDSNINFLFDIPETTGNNYLNQRTRRNLFLVIKESMNNIIKHSGADQVVLAFMQDKNSCSIVITDNGQGFDINNPRPLGNGLQNMKKRMQDIEGTFQIDSEKGIFTRTTVTWHM